MTLSRSSARPGLPGAVPPARSGASGPGLLLLLVLLLLAVAGAALCIGARPLTPAIVRDALLAYDGGNFDHVALWQFRLPRIAAAALAGSGLALSGLVLQTAIRNPLAEPQLLGLNAGAVLFVVLAAGLGLGAVWGRGLLAATGAFAVFGLVMAIAGAGRGGLAPLRVTLCGIVVSALAGAITSAVLILDRDTMSELRIWLAGDLGNPGWAEVTGILPLWSAGVGMALAVAPQLSVLAMGDTVATGLGVRILRARLLAMAAAALLCGAAVTLAGPIGFLGLIVPHLLRPFTRAKLRLGLVAALPAGAMLLIAADILARRLIAPAELATGVMTGSFGAAVFILMVARLLR